MPRTTIRSEDVTDAQIKTADMAVDPTNASNLSSGDVPLAQLGNVPPSDTSGLEDDIAILGFKVAANGSLAKYNLDDQTVDAFEDASGVDASASTNEFRTSSNYYTGSSGDPTGGTITTSGGKTIHTFTSTGTFTSGAGNLEYLIVGGGGGGGSAGGGGGGGGYRYNGAVDFEVAGGAKAVTVGSGGTGGGPGGGRPGGSGTGTVATQGGSSIFSTITSAGGGAGGSEVGAGTTGGSGGGGSHSSTTYQSGYAGNTPSTSPVQGFAGGDGYDPNNPTATGGGGGGASAAGVNGGNAANGNGGAGAASSISGASVTYAGGGGGGTRSNSNVWAGPGGAGGGGDGTSHGDVASSGTDGLGGGGGGGGHLNGGGNQGGGGPGGDGVVIFSFPTGDLGQIDDMTLVSNSTTANAQPTKGDIVMTYTNGSGVATINTDLIASVSRDNGTTYTAATLVSQGTTGGHTILSAHDLDISGQPAGTSMRWKIATTDQSASKETRIHAVSLGWS